MHQMYIRISFARVRNRSSLLVRFVSQNWFKLFLFIYLLPISNFSLFRFHTKRLPLFDRKRMPKRRFDGSYYYCCYYYYYYYYNNNITTSSYFPVHIGNRKR